ncbi:H-NS histone family protein [Paraburkholderia sacchari]|uniref:H-NS histone family protein n=2 Tax=Paraburkholderia sacchari TaxID=159450 RepID=UPI001BCF2A1D|nr:H-NS histone family protein [Paraburkholderia sacchari]
MASAREIAKSRQQRAEASAEQLSRAELHAVVVDMRCRIRRFSITPEQLFGPDLSDLVKYRDPATGNTWNGHGRPPNWIRGRNRDQFSVD